MTHKFKPSSAKNFIPEWYKRSELYAKVPNGMDISGLKTCIPFLDAMTNGYMLVTPTDIIVSRDKDNSPIIEWDKENFPDLWAIREGTSGELIPRPSGYGDEHFIWQGIWGMKTPKKWSILVTHPINRMDLPFYTLSGIIDSDMYYVNGNLPFFLRSDFIGSIPAGTPIAQIIPIKRGTWSSNYYPSLTNSMIDLAGATRNSTNYYKKKKWIRKDFV